MFQSGELGTPEASWTALAPGPLPGSPDHSFPISVEIGRVFLLSHSLDRGHFKKSVAAPMWPSQPQQRSFLDEPEGAQRRKGPNLARHLDPARPCHTKCPREGPQLALWGSSLLTVTAGAFCLLAGCVPRQPFLAVGPGSAPFLHTPCLLGLAPGGWDSRVSVGRTGAPPVSELL